jgi:PhnB protein
MRVDPYLYLQGRCKEALEFYKNALGAEIQTVVRFSDLPDAPPGSGDNIMHAALRIGETLVLASDGQGKGSAVFEGFSLALSTPSDAEAEKLFAALSKDGAVRLPLMSTSFASRMGIVADRFGVPWMIVAQRPMTSR